MLPSPLEKLTSRAASTGYGLKVLAESGILKPYSPIALAKAGISGMVVAQGWTATPKLQVVDCPGEVLLDNISKLFQLSITPEQWIENMNKATGK